MAARVPKDIIGVHDLRDANKTISYDEIFLRKQRLEFYLLTSLGTRVMFKWLPSNYVLAPNAKTIELGGSSIVIRSHLPSLSPWMQRFRQENQEFSKTIRQLKQMVNTADDALRIMKGANGNDNICDNFYKQSQLLESLSAILQEKVQTIATQAPRVPLFVGSIIGRTSLDSPNPIFDAYRRANPRFSKEEDAIERLEAIFGCKGECYCLEVTGQCPWGGHAEGEPHELAVLPCQSRDQGGYFRSSDVWVQPSPEHASVTVFCMNRHWILPDTIRLACTAGVSSYEGSRLSTLFSSKKVFAKVANNQTRE